jgi:predicted RNase H-like HicB family nuclease
LSHNLQNLKVRQKGFIAKIQHKGEGKLTMLASYIDQAMELAVYEIIEDDEIYWGEIPSLQGVWASHKTLEGCRRELREALSDWLALRLHLGLMIPVIAGINLNELTKPV